MTIARRLIILLGLPLIALLGLGTFTRIQLARIEARSRFVAESRIAALATLGNLSRGFSEMRVNLRSHLLATDAAGRSRARALYDEDERDVARLLQQYADTMVQDGRDRRLHGDFQALSREWATGARQAMAFADEGRRDEAVSLLNGRVSEIGVRLSQVSDEWITADQETARVAGEESIQSIERFQRQMLIANSTAFLLALGLGFLTFRRIVGPILIWDPKSQGQ